MWGECREGVSSERRMEHTPVENTGEQSGKGKGRGLRGQEKKEEVRDGSDLDRWRQGLVGALS